jgi:hypothetical protein
MLPSTLILDTIGELEDYASTTNDYFGDKAKRSLEEIRDSQIEESNATI